jgi:hypothetical protein
MAPCWWWQHRYEAAEAEGSDCNWFYVKQQLRSCSAEMARGSLLVVGRTGALLVGRVWLLSLMLVVSRDGSLLVVATDV